MSDRIGLADASWRAPFPSQSPAHGRIGYPIEPTISIAEVPMTARMYRLTQIHQRIDERLRLEARKARPDGLEVLRLAALKARAKTALAVLTGRTVVPA